MPIKVTYRCGDCGHQFEAWKEGDQAPPDCPSCVAAPPMARIPGLFAISTNVSRAIDFAQHMAETQYGLTNMRDNLREGDIAAPKPEMVSNAKVDEIVREMKNAHEQAHAAPPPDMPGNWWGANAQAGAALPQADPAAVAAYSAETRASGTDAVSLVESAKRKGVGGMRLHVHGRYNEEPTG